MEPEKLAAELSKRGNAWAELDQAASMLEETKKSVIAQAALAADASSQGAKETQALASALVREHITEMVTARGKANIAKVNFDVYRTYIELLRTKQATMRAEMGLR